MFSGSLKVDDIGFSFVVDNDITDVEVSMENTNIAMEMQKHAIKLTPIPRQTQLNMPAAHRTATQRT